MLSKYPDSLSFLVVPDTEVEDRKKRLTTVGFKSGMAVLYFSATHLVPRQSLEFAAEDYAGPIFPSARTAAEAPRAAASSASMALVPVGESRDVSTSFTTTSYSDDKSVVTAFYFFLFYFFFILFFFYFFFELVLPSLAFSNATTLLVILSLTFSILLLPVPAGAAAIA